MKVLIVLLGLLSVSTGQFSARNRKALCYLPSEYGKCGGHRMMWTFSNRQQKCVPFLFSNCGGNENRFFTKENCESACAPTDSPFEFYG
uniref:Kunitz-type serine protease inhibitor textilinin-3 n=1 Tax=Drosophila rhopaloa TaxID=1041015 RepID=A0A6P4FVE1_DRORH